VKPVAVIYQPHQAADNRQTNTENKIVKKRICFWWAEGLGLHRLLSGAITFST
jgi:hypothetical protein